MCHKLYTTFKTLERNNWDQILIVWSGTSSTHVWTAKCRPRARLNSRQTNVCHLPPHEGSPIHKARLTAFKVNYATDRSSVVFRRLRQTVDRPWLSRRPPHVAHVTWMALETIRIMLTFPLYLTPDNPKSVLTQKLCTWDWKLCMSCECKSLIYLRLRCRCSLPLVIKFVLPFLQFLRKKQRMA